MSSVVRVGTVAFVTTVTICYVLIYVLVVGVLMGCRLLFE